ncbi:MAG: hypothetical protein ACRDYU_08155 [Actinomycetes bacterium]
MDRLVAACGEQQPWALLQTDRLDEIRAMGGGWGVVMLDAHLPAELREEEDDARAESLRGAGRG